MKYRRLGRTGLLVSEMCLGTNTFGGSGPIWGSLGALDQAAANEVMNAAHQAGVNFLDTADIYGEGESEQRIGVGLRDLGIARADIVIATKGGGRVAASPNAIGGSRKHIVDALDASLRRLQTDHVDVYMLHFPDPATPVEETVRALDDVVRAGKARYLGCSNFAAWTVMKALGISEREHRARFEIMESHWSPATRAIEAEVLPMARDNAMGLLVWGPLLGGLLTGKYTRDGASAGGGRMSGYIPPTIDRERLFDLLDVMRGIAEQKEATVAQVALAWVLREPAVSSVLFGSRTPGQVAENVAAAELVLSGDDVAAIDAFFAPQPDYAQAMVSGTSDERRAYA